jgi:class 3 adenylate cyclase
LKRGGKVGGANSDVSAERRRLTILFCDLVDSTGLANRLDPEEAGSIILRYLRIVEEIVDRFEGHVDRLVGDGALVYFGWPVAHEDQVERAVAAGLEIVRRVARLEAEPGVDLKCRVGIATGDVVVGEVFGAKERWETVVGPTPILAARLQAAASPQSVVVDRSTCRELRGSFIVEQLPPLSLKGFSEPVPAWRVLAPLPRESRFSARFSTPSPVVGRDAELALMLDSWRKARHGDGRAVLVSGEPGIGKSRLLEALIETIGLRPSHACAFNATRSTAIRRFILFFRSYRRVSDSRRRTSLLTGVGRSSMQLACCFTTPAKRSTASWDYLRRRDVMLTRRSRRRFVVSAQSRRWSNISYAKQKSSPRSFLSRTFNGPTPPLSMSFH